ncbi:MAG: protein phosphatase 2C domain-containing protein [Myxococcota bacterium]
MKTAFLRGREHQQIGGIALEGLGPAAIALSRGGARKTYDHTDPNEDCAALAIGEGGQLVIAADGHHGELGSEAALEAILAEAAPRLTAATAPTTSLDAWRELAFEALLLANRAVLEIAGRSKLPPAPTTLVLALARPADDLLIHASVGDSHLFAIDAAGATELGGRDPAWKFTPFLGYEQATRALLERYARVGVRSLSALRAVALVTDGISEPGIGVEDPARAVHASVRGIEPGTAADLSAVRACRTIVELAMGAHRRQQAGDNLACSVVWLGRDA